MANYLFGSTARYFRNKRNAKAKKRLVEKKRQRDIRKGFQHKSSVPKQFDVKPDLPTHGSNRTKTIRRRVKQRFSF